MVQFSMVPETSGSSISVQIRVTKKIEELWFVTKAKNLSTVSFLCLCLHKKSESKGKHFLTIQVKWQKNINGWLMDLRFPICTGFIKAKTVAWIELMRADQFSFLLRPRGISRQALGGANDDKFMQLRRHQRTFARRCAPASTEIFLMI